MAEAAPISTSAWKRLESDIQGALTTFDKARDWSDLAISIQRLQKVIAKPPNAPNTPVPCLILLGKRLSQCLVPNLPSGIHTRTLRVYEAILARLGNERLIQALPVLLPGLHAFYPSASTAVRLVCIEIFEQYIVPNLSRLTPLRFELLSCFVISGEDDKFAEHDKYSKYLNAWEAVLGLVGLQNTLWEIAARIQSRRLGALRTLGRRQDRFALEGGDPPVALLEAIQSCLVPGEVVEPPGSPHLARDASTTTGATSRPATVSPQVMLLSQRLILDVLLQAVPLTTAQLNRTQKLSLMSHVVPLCTIKDASIRCRVTQWLLSSDAETGALVGDSSLSSARGPDEGFPMFRARSAPYLSSVLLSIIEELRKPNQAVPSPSFQWALARGTDHLTHFLQLLHFLFLETHGPFYGALFPTVSVALVRQLRTRCPRSNWSTKCPVRNWVKGVVTDETGATSEELSRALFSYNGLDGVTLLYEAILKEMRSEEVVTDLHIADLLCNAQYYFSDLAAPIALAEVEEGLPKSDSDEHSEESGEVTEESPRLLSCASTNHVLALVGHHLALCAHSLRILPGPKSLEIWYTLVEQICSAAVYLPAHFVLKDTPPIVSLIEPVDTAFRELISGPRTALLERETTLTALCKARSHFKSLLSESLLGELRKRMAEWVPSSLTQLCESQSISVGDQLESALLIAEIGENLDETELTSLLIRFTGARGLNYDFLTRFWRQIGVNSLSQIESCWLSDRADRSDAYGVQLLQVLGTIWSVYTRMLELPSEIAGKDTIFSEFVARFTQSCISRVFDQVAETSPSSTPTTRPNKRTSLQSYRGVSSQVALEIDRLLASLPVFAKQKLLAAAFRTLLDRVYAITIPEPRQSQGYFRNAFAVQTLMRDLIITGILWRIVARPNPIKAEMIVLPDETLKLLEGIESADTLLMPEIGNTSEQASFAGLALTAYKPVTFADLLRILCAKFAVAQFPSEEPFRDEAVARLNSIALEIFVECCHVPTSRDFRKPRELFCVFGEFLLDAWKSRIMQGRVDIGRHFLEAYQVLGSLADSNCFGMPLVSDITLAIMRRHASPASDEGGVSPANRDSSSIAQRANLSLVYSIAQRVSNLPVSDPHVLTNINLVLTDLVEGNTDLLLLEETLSFLLSFVSAHLDRPSMLARCEGAALSLAYLLHRAKTVEAHRLLLQYLIWIAKKGFGVGDIVESTQTAGPELHHQLSNLQYYFEYSDAIDLSDSPARYLHSHYPQKQDRPLAVAALGRKANASPSSNWTGDNTVSLLALVLDDNFFVHDPILTPLRSDLICMFWNKSEQSLLASIHNAWASLSMSGVSDEKVLQCVNFLTELPCWDVVVFWKETAHLLAKPESELTVERNLKYTLRSPPMIQLLCMVTQHMYRDQNPSAEVSLALWTEYQEMVAKVTQPHPQPMLLLWLVELLTTLSSVAVVTREHVMNTSRGGISNLFFLIWSLMSSSTKLSMDTIDLLPPLPHKLEDIERKVLSSVAMGEIGLPRMARFVLKPTLAATLTVPEAHTDVNQESPALTGASETNSPLNSSAQPSTSLCLGTQLVSSSTAQDILAEYASASMLSFIIHCRKNLETATASVLIRLLNHQPLLAHLVTLLNQYGVQSCTATRYLSLVFFLELVCLSLRLALGSHAKTHSRPILSGLLPIGQAATLMENLAAASQNFLTKVSKSFREWGLNSSLTNMQQQDRRCFRVCCQLMAISHLLTLVRRNSFGVPSSALFNMSSDIGGLWKLLGATIDLDETFPLPSVGLFTTWTAELTQRCSYLFRLAVVIFALPTGTLNTDVDNIVQRLSEQCKASQAREASDLKVRILLCLRMLVLKINSSQSQASLWPLIVSELGQVLTTAGYLSALLCPEARSAKTPIENSQVLAALKLLDILSLIKPSFPYLHCFLPACILDPVHRSAESMVDTEAPSGIASRDSALESDGEEAKEVFPAYEPLVLTVHRRCDQMEIAKGMGGLEDQSLKERLRARKALIESVPAEGSSSRPVFGPVVRCGEVRSAKHLMNIIETLCLAHIERQVYASAPIDYVDLERSIEEELTTLPSQLRDWAEGLSLSR